MDRGRGNRSATERSGAPTGGVDRPAETGRSAGQTSQGARQLIDAVAQQGAAGGCRVQVAETATHVYELQLDNAEARGTVAWWATDRDSDTTDGIVVVLANVLAMMFAGLHGRPIETRLAPVVDGSRAVQTGKYSWAIPVPNAEARSMLDTVARDTGQTRAETVSWLTEAGLAMQRERERHRPVTGQTIH